MSIESFMKVGQNIGDTWSYRKLLENSANLDEVIISVIISDDKKTSIAIYKITDGIELSSKNLNYIKLIPDQKHDLINNLVSKHVDVDFISIPKNELSSKNLNYIKLIPDQKHDLINNLVSKHVDVDFLSIIKNELLEIADKVGEAFFNIGIYIIIFRIISYFIRVFLDLDGSMISDMISPFNPLSSGNIDIIDPNSINTTFIDVSINTTFIDVAGCDEAKF
jgi:ATP-dependent Zn protease